MRDALMYDQVPLASAASHLLDALQTFGIEYVFANLGSDHPGIVEAFALAAETGRPLPKLITCPNEMVAMSAAHGHAMVSGRAQAVLVHVECGTQALAGAVHNADKGRVPVLLLAGASPFTQDGEARGSRNEFIHWIQDVHDQRGLVRGYMRYDAELRTGANIGQMIGRALTFAHSEPQGPVYLMAAREVLEAEFPAIPLDPAHWRPLAPAALAPPDLAALAQDLLAAQRPLVVTSYAGRNPGVPSLLAALADRTGLGVIESAPSRLNLAHDHPAYLGNQWNQQHQNAALAEADFVLVLDADVPWIPTVSRPAPGARIWHLDLDPLKQAMPVFWLHAARTARVDAETALRQLLDSLGSVDPAHAQARRAHWLRLRDARATTLAARETLYAEGRLTPAMLTARIRAKLPQGAIVLNEGITNYGVICDHIAPTEPGCFYTSGAGSLGWNGGAAIGAKLAAPDRFVASLTGDGCFLFSVPSSVHWMARRYQTPFLQVVYDNGGWGAPRFSTLAVHPTGAASRSRSIGVEFDQPADYAGIAEASGGAHPERVETADQLDAALDRAIEMVAVHRRTAVVSVKLPRH